MCLSCGLSELKSELVVLIPWPEWGVSSCCVDPVD